MPFDNHTVRRIVTTHDPTDIDGNNISIIDQNLPLPLILNGNAQRSSMFTHLGAPAISSHTITEKEIGEANALTESVTLKNGVTSCIMDMKPESKIGLHRTESVDHGVILNGSVWMITPNGIDDEDKWEKTLLKAGDVFIQRGTSHAWEAGPEGVRFFTVMVHAKPVKIETQGKELIEFWS